MNRRKLTVLIALPVALVAGAYAARGYLMRPKPLLPTFEDPGPGPRAPRSDALGVEVGRTDYDALAEWAEDRGLGCRDTSAKALMTAMRAKKKAERERKIAAGEEVDAVSSASKKAGGSPMMRNPQVRYSCEGTEGRALDARAISPTGRALFVFDSPDHPLRHASFRRMHREAVRGLVDARAALESLEARFGPAHDVTRPFPETSEGLEQWAPHEYRWGFADLEVRLTLIDYGPRGTNVYEAVQVPLPVRPDAPADPRPSLAAR